MALIPKMLLSKLLIEKRSFSGPSHRDALIHFTLELLSKAPTFGKA